MCQKSRTETLLMAVMECADHDWSKPEVDALEVLLEREVAAAEALLTAAKAYGKFLPHPNAQPSVDSKEWWASRRDIGSAIANYERSS